MREVVFTSDQHYNHEGAIKYCNRPFNSKEEMNEALIKAHNEFVPRWCDVYHVGDFAWKDHGMFVNRLNGRHILVLGNHDKMNRESLSAFSEIVDIKQLKIYGQRIVMCHFPMEGWWNRGGGAWMLHGHTHCINLKPMKRLFIGVDGRRDMRPWGFEEISEVMNELPRY